MKKINWKDFKIKDLKPNLIPNGWDSFEPYGNEGKETKAPLEVFEDNYIPNCLLNGDFRNGVDNWGKTSIDLASSSDGLICTATDKNTYARIVQLKDVTQGDKYYVKVTITPSHDGSLGINIGALKTISGSVTPNVKKSYTAVVDVEKDNTVIWITHSTLSYELGEKYTIHSVQLVNLSKFYGVGNEPTKEWCDKNLKYYANWSDIASEDKPVKAWDNMAVHMTPLGNGLTRIQTWGGNDKLKLLYSVGLRSTAHTASGFFDNKGKPFTVLNNQGYITEQVLVNDSKYISLVGDKDAPGSVQFGIRAINDKSDTLDFIASDPQIVEGDKANPALIITELEDGREHVQVYGVKNDTKLISPEIEGFSGEPYQIKTDIENNGIEMSMDTTLGDKSIDVNKGSNSISHTGELQGQHIIIELGAKYE